MLNQYSKFLLKGKKIIMIKSVNKLNKVTVKMKSCVFYKAIFFSWFYVYYEGKIIM